MDDSERRRCAVFYAAGNLRTAAGKAPERAELLTPLSEMLRAIADFCAPEEFAAMLEEVRR